MTLSRDLTFGNTHLNEFALNSLSTLFREPLVVVGSTCCTVSITVNLNVRVVVNSILSNSAYIYEVVLRSNVGLVDVEEYRYRSGDEFLNRLARSSRTWFRLVLQQVLEAGILGISLVQTSVERVDLSLRESLDSVNIGNAIPSGLAKVQGQTNFTIDILVVATPDTAAITSDTITIETVDIILVTVPTGFNVEGEAVRQTELVQQTEAETHSIAVGVHVAANTTTSERDDAPETVGVVTTNHVAQIEEHVLIGNPILCSVRILDAVISYTMSQNSTSPDTLYLCTETDSRSKPLTDGNRYARV